MNKKVIVTAAAVTGVSLTGGVIVGKKVSDITKSPIIGMAAGFATAKVIGSVMDEIVLRPLLMKDVVDEFNQYADAFDQWFDEQTTGTEENPQS